MRPPLRHHNLLLPLSRLTIQRTHHQSRNIIHYRSPCWKLWNLIFAATTTEAASLASATVTTTAAGAIAREGRVDHVRHRRDQWRQSPWF